MKYADREMRTYKQVQMERIGKYNAQELADFMKNWNISDVPENLKNAVSNLEYRISGIRIMTYDDFCDHFPARTMRGSFFAILGDKNPKNGFPTLCVYSPELEPLVNDFETRSKKQNNMRRISVFVQKICGLHMENNYAFKNFIMNVLPANIPYNLYIDGSRIRVALLAEKPNAKMYGDSENEIFAVEHTIGENRTLTIFIKEVDYIGEFQMKLIKKLEIDDELALQISQALPHDRYYSINEVVETNFEKFVTQMARNLKLNSGDIAHDILQGDVEVVTGAYSRKVALNLDDELPAAILVENRLNLYVPDWGELGADD